MLSNRGPKKKASEMISLGNKVPKKIKNKKYGQIA
jgi:hypothetical protein